jgi:uncharacterized repeat protein (TIGR01451 family)
MKKIIIFFAFIILCCSKSNAQYVTIPDQYFKQFLIDHYPGCMNASGMLDTTCTAVVNETTLNLSLPVPNQSYWIHDFTGVQYFKNLNYLDISFAVITSAIIFPPSLDSLATNFSYAEAISGLNLPRSLKYWKSDYCSLINSQPYPDSLLYLSARSAGLTQLQSLPTGLLYLDVASDFSNYQNNISSLPQLPPTLKYLDCAGNRLLLLPDLPPGLTYLNCTYNGTYTGSTYNGLSTLPTLPPLLDTLDCVNPLSEMPSLPTGITYLRFGGGTMTSIPALPPGLKTLKIEGAQSLASLPSLPGTITYMSCYNTAISPLPALPAALQTFIFEIDTMLTTLPAFPAGVEYISCWGNRLTTFPTLPVPLAYLNCSSNRITSLPALPAGLLHLNAAYNRLTTFPALPSSLNWLFVNDNQLFSMPALNNTQLYHLNCANNSIPALSVLPATLNGLFCNNNQLTSLPALPNELDTLFCDNNNITTLPALNGQLSMLMCHNNQLSELPEFNSSLYGITCYGNNIYCLPRLPQTNCPLQIILDTAQVKCLPNRIVNGIVQDYRQGTGLDMCGSGLYHWVDLPLCNPTNNNTNCHAYPVISGTAFYDINSNGVKDNNELYKQNLSVRLQNGEYTFTDANGYFDIAAVGTGNNTITMGAVRFYNVVPPSSLYNFTSYDTTVTKDYALKPAVIKDSVSIALVPDYWAARPGFYYSYRMLYENIGTTILNHTLQLDYDSSKLVYDSASNPLAVNTGNSITLATSNFLPGQRGTFNAYFSVKTTAPLNSPLIAKATITSGSETWIDSSHTEISGAYDPNDKHATPQLSPSQVAAGSFINYTIRFQNTGTDTAFNVVLSDTLSNLLQYNTLQMIATSHNCKTTVKDGIAYFEFRNILLPDSNVNEKQSHGFVSFKIKPQTNVAVNTIIPNSAAIYFDYNAPVITNTAGTLIKDFTIVPLKLISFNAVPQNDNTVSLYWNTANEINTKQFVIEKSNDGLRFGSITTVFAKGKVNNSYNAVVADANTGIIFYRLKMMDNDGSFTYSPVIKIDRRKNAAGFSILSNPVKDFIVISTTDRTLNNTQASIINMQGAVVKSFIVKEGSQAIDIKDLPTGIYYIKSINSSQKILVR